MRVVFENTKRGRPIVLTDHELRSLSHVVGRDVLADVQRLAADRYDAVTLGQLMRTLTKILRERQHAANSDCWCMPTLDFKDAHTNVGVWVHKRAQ